MPNDDQTARWEELKTAWHRGRRMEVSPEEFHQLFYDGKRSREAQELVRASTVAHALLRRAAMGVSDINDNDVRHVWLAVQEDDAAGELYSSHRDRLTPGDRKRFIHDIIPYLIEQQGRSFIRGHFHRWWKLPLLEEEREALIEAAASNGIRDLPFYRSFGPMAVAIAGRRIWRHGSPDLWGPPLAFGAPGPSGPPPAFSSRFEVLLSQVELATDLRDACLTPAELAQLGAWSTRLAPPWSALRRAMRHIGRSAFNELAIAMTEHVAQAGAVVKGGNGLTWGFSVLRLLHLQQILEAPILSKVVRDPALALVPDVALYLMGRDAVVFQPELRVLRGTDRRWRARWAETAGEAASAMILEDTVQLDLGTLCRVPERNDQPTPDFMAGTVPGQNVVFESKGSTGWRTHLKQRRRAVEQLGKNASSNASSWATDGRCFACSLFAAEQGDERTSLLHVDDPPFNFRREFGEGWPWRSRREHAIAMLQAARLYELADELAERRPASVRERREVSSFHLPGEGQEEGASFVGTYLPIGEWARSMGHPDLRSCERIQVFVGIEAGLYHSFENGRFPSFLAPDVDSAESTDTTTAAPGVGVLPGEGGGASGVYSLLGDGAFLALRFV